MLIVTQPGDCAIVFENVSVIKIDKTDLVICLSEKPWSPSSPYTKLSWYGIAEFPDRVAAQRALNGLIDAYEKGTKVFRISPIKFYAADTSQNED